LPALWRAESESESESANAQEVLLSNVARFADEHQQEIDARDAIESGLSSRAEDDNGHEDITSELEIAESDIDVELAGSEEDDADTASGDTADAVDSDIEVDPNSPDLLNDTLTGDPPNLGDTLH